jgi:hypothetical protein
MEPPRTFVSGEGNKRAMLCEVRELQGLEPFTLLVLWLECMRAPQISKLGFLFMLKRKIFPVIKITRLVPKAVKSH